MAHKRNATRHVNPGDRKRCEHCDAPVTKAGVYEGSVLGNVDDVSDDDRARIAMWCMTLATYCMMLNDANAAAHSGLMEQARDMRKRADRVYEQLPRFLRW